VIGSEFTVGRQARMRDIVDDADREAVTRFRGGARVERGFGHRGGEFLGPEPVPTADHTGPKAI
jgi:hypothetical protein